MLKRAFDILVAGLALIALTPLLSVIAVAVWFDAGWPVLFRQQRVGRAFRPFQLLKFRSMRPNKGGPQITVAGDARVTLTGRFLRRTKLDELPQLWNVVRGDLSLVGPRPEVPVYVEMYRDRYAKVLSVRPGISDFASIQFRNEEQILSQSPDPLKEYVERVLPAKLDLAEQYVERHSMATDIEILARTFTALIRDH